MNHVESGSGKGSERLIAIVVHIDLLGDPAKTEMVGNHKGIHKVILGQVRIGFLKLFDLLRIENMNFPLEPAKTAILPESIDKAVPIDRGGFQTDHHITELHGAKRRHDSF